MNIGPDRYSCDWCGAECRASEVETTATAEGPVDVCTQCIQREKTDPSLAPERWAQRALEGAYRLYDHLDPARGGPAPVASRAFVPIGFPGASEAYLPLADAQRRLVGFRGEDPATGTLLLTCTVCERHFSVDPETEEVPTGAHPDLTPTVLIPVVCAACHSQVADGLG